MDVVVSLEDLEPLSVLYDTQSHWEGSDVLLNIDTTSQAGSAIGQSVESIVFDTASSESTAARMFVTFVPSSKGFIQIYKQTSFEFSNVAVSGAPAAGDFTLNLKIRTGSHVGTVVASIDEIITLSRRTIVNPIGVIDTYVWEQSSGGIFSSIKLPVLNGVTYYIETSITGLPELNKPGFPVEPYVTIPGDGIVIDVPENSVDCNLTTSEFDLGVIPLEPTSLFYSGDSLESGSSLSYHLWGGNTSPATIDLGVVGDGDSIPSYRYYFVVLSFSSTTGGRAFADRLQISTSSLNYITNRPIPELGLTHPLLYQGGVRELSSKMDREKPTTTGESSLTLGWSPWLGGIIHDEFLRGKGVAIDIGFPGMPFSEFAPFYKGTWYDYKANHVEGFIDVSLRDVLTRFRKVKIPKETTDVSGNITTVPLVWADVNILQVMLEIFEAMGIPDRLIAVTAFTDLRDGDYSPSIYNVTRTVTKPIEAFKLLNELSVVSGIFLVPYADGKLYPIPYDGNTPQVAIFDARFMDFGTIEGGYKDLFTRQLMYFDPNTATPGDKEEDYDKLLININAGIEEEWEDYSEKRWFEKWDANPIIVDDLGARFSSWFATPKKVFKVTNVTISNIEVQLGDIVHIDNLHIPVAEADWPGVINSLHGLVLKRDLSLAGSLSYLLAEVEEPVQYFPDSVTLLVGTEDGASGGVSAMEELDGVYYIIDEVGGGAGGFTADFSFLIPDGVDVGQIVFNGFYSGAHNVKLQVFDSGATSPDYVNVTTEITDFPPSTQNYFIVWSFNFTDTFFAPSVGGFRKLVIRVFHDLPGNVTHRFNADRFFLR